MSDLTGNNGSEDIDIFKDVPGLPRGFTKRHERSFLIVSRKW